MANYVNWMQANQMKRDGVLPSQGNPAANHEALASGVSSSLAPEGAQYAMVWSDVKVTVSATNLGGSGSQLSGGKTIAIPANRTLEIPNVKVGETTITLTTIV